MGFSSAEADESVEVFAAWCEPIARLKPTAAIEERPGLSLAFADMAWSMTNAATFTAPAESERAWGDRIQQARDFFRAPRRQRRWILVVRQDWLSDAGRRTLAALGMRPMMQLEGMAAPRLRPPRRPPPSDLVVERITDHEARCALADINASAYHVPPTWGREVAEIAEPIWSGENYAHVGRVGGRPVSVCVTTRMERLLHMGWVATLAEYRSKGYAEAVMRRGLEEAGARYGLERTVLHASDAGYPLYRQMGYHSVARFAVYEEASPSEVKPG